MKRSRHPIYGLMVEFASTGELIAACRRTRAQGYRRIDAFTPAPVHGLTEAIGYVGKGWTARTVFLAGLAGAIGGFGLQYWVAAIAYPLNIGGKPYFSWPAFIPVTFELTILCGTLGAVLGMLWWNRLPMPYHPVFNVPRFKLASSDRFFLMVESIDPAFDPPAVRRFLEGLDGCVGVYDVEY